MRRAQTRLPCSSSAARDGVNPNPKPAMPADGGYDAAYQGAPGAYSEDAAHRLLGARARLLPRDTLASVFEAVGSGASRYGVLPIENCLAGAVPEAIDLLAAHPFGVAGETQVHIDHALLARPGTRLGHVRRVLSHPVALAQCRAFFASHPNIEPVPVFDTAGAVGIVVRDETGVSAALAARRAGDLYGADVLAEHLQDHPENWTRFLLLTRSMPVAPDDAPQKTLVMFELAHEPGALARALDPLARHGANLTRIQSQPVRGRPFEYRFSVEMTAPTGLAMRGAIEGLRSATIAFRSFGTYPAR